MRNKETFDIKVDLVEYATTNRVHRQQCIKVTWNNPPNTEYPIYSEHFFREKTQKNAVVMAKRCVKDIFARVYDDDRGVWNTCQIYMHREIWRQVKRLDLNQKETLCGQRKSN